MCSNRDLIVEFKRFNSGKHRNTANAKKQILRRYLFVRARRYLEDIADFVKAITRTMLSGSV